MIDTKLPLKICYKCNEEQPLTFFSKNRTKKDGLNLECRKCSSVRSLKWKIDNPKRSRANDRINQAKRLENGLCCNCSNAVMLNHNRMCEKHWYIEAAQHATRKGTVANGVKLHQKMILQQYTCPYTGEKLVPGINAHLDHIYPRHRFPELEGDMDNLEWVSDTANLAKRVMTKDEFVNFCRLIASRFPGSLV